MITIPTSELTGLLADVIPFAYPDDELPMLNGVRVEWDGERLHAQTTDRYRIAWSQWDPDDDPDEDVQEDMFTQWGASLDEDPWNVLLPLAAAKAVTKNYRLPVKESVRCPLQLEMGWNRLTVRRARESGHDELITVIEGVPQESAVGYPDLRELLAKNDVIWPVKGLSFTPKLVADFAKVRPRGSLEMRFTGPKSLVHVSIGERFVGAIMPVRPADPPAAEATPKPAATNEPTLDLRTASGVLLSESQDDANP